MINKKILAIKMTDKKGVKADKILGKHIVTLEYRNKVYFSVNLRVCQEAKKNLDTLILYLPSTDTAYICEVDDVFRAAKGRMVPPRSREYSPEEYADIPCATWFSLTEIRPADDDELSSLYPVNDAYGYTVRDKFDSGESWRWFYVTDHNRYNWENAC